MKGLLNVSTLNNALALTVFKCHWDLLDKEEEEGLKCVDSIPGLFSLKKPKHKWSKIIVHIQILI